MGFCLDKDPNRARSYPCGLRTLDYHMAGMDKKTVDRLPYLPRWASGIVG